MDARPVDRKGKSNMLQRPRDVWKRQLDPKDFPTLQPKDEYEGDANAVSGPYPWKKGSLNPVAGCLRFACRGTSPQREL